MRDPLPPFPRRRWILLCLTGPFALALSMLLPAAFVEKQFSRSLYPLLASAYNVLFGWTHQSIAELILYGLLLTALIWPLVAWISLQRPSLKSKLFWRMAGRGGMRGLGVLSLLVFLFYGTWALNYRRQPLAQQLQWPTGPFGVSELEGLTADLRLHLDRLAPRVPRDSRHRFQLTDPREVYTAAIWALQGVRQVYQLPVAASAPLKSPFFKPLLNTTLTYGVFSPWTLEAHLNPTIPDCDKPFTAVHELAHFQGIAREDEANFLAWAACSRHHDLRLQYSAHLHAFSEAVSQLPPPKRQRFIQNLPVGVLADFQAAEEWLQAHQGNLSKASRAAYHSYLKSQGQQDGLKSYGRFLDLMLAERRTLAAPKKQGGMQSPSQRALHEEC